MIYSLVTSATDYEQTLGVGLLDPPPILDNPLHISAQKIHA